MMIARRHQQLHGLALSDTRVGRRNGERGRYRRLNTDSKLVRHSLHRGLDERRIRRNPNRQVVVHVSRSEISLYKSTLVNAKRKNTPESGAARKLRRQH